MSHVIDPLVWNEGIYAGTRREKDRLVLILDDGSHRYMNYENWNETTTITANKLGALKPGAKIRIATWSTYDPKQWFCDVEEIK
jgi:hypothetical protein